TIATKYGLSPPQLSRLHRIAAPLARMVYHRSTLAKKLLESRVFKRKKQPPTGSVVGPAQSPGDTISRRTIFLRTDMERNLHQSLRNLATDSIDIYLLHECVPANMSDEVLDSLNRFIDQGKIRSYGLATGRSASAEILSLFPGFRGTVQIPLNILDGAFEEVRLDNNLLTITHSALNRLVDRLKNHLCDNATTKRWSKAVSFDLTKPGSVTRFLLAHARQANPDGMVLFSSRKSENIRLSARFLQAPDISPENLAAFAVLVRQELIRR